MPRDLARLEYRIGYYFKDRKILKEAMTHGSVRNRAETFHRAHHERLEFFGDSVIGLVLAEYYYILRPDARPGELSVLRSNAVNGNKQYDIAVDIQVMEYVEMETSLANQGTFKRWGEFIESLIGAVYFDAEDKFGYGRGFEMAKEVIYRLWNLQLD